MDGKISVLASLPKLLCSSFSAPKNKAPDTTWLSDFVDKLASPHAPMLEEIPSCTSYLVSESWLDSPFQMQELLLPIQNIKISSPGIDKIPYSVIQRFPPNIKSYFLEFINKIFESGQVPEEWKIQKILPILKPSKDPLQGSSYRPIALSSCMLKVVEHMIRNRLEWHVESRQDLSQSQFGFRKKRSVMDNLSLLTTDIRAAQSQKKCTTAAFIDICGAYDNVNLSILQNKLSKLKVPKKLIQLILNILRERTIIIEGSSQKFLRKVWKGLPQGSVMSPLLYNIYTYDLDLSLDKLCCVLQYADDVVIYCFHKNIADALKLLSEALKLLNNWLNLNDLQLSPLKSQVVIFTNKHKVPFTSISCDNFTIPVTNQVRFLGIIFDRKLSWAPHINSVVAKCETKINPLRALAGVWWGSHPVILKLFYNAFIRSHLDYGSIIFDPLPKYLASKLTSIQSKSLRIVIGAMRSSPINALQLESLDPPLDLRRQYLADRFFVKCSRITNHPLLLSTETLSKVIPNNPFWKNKNIPVLIKSYIKYKNYIPELIHSPILPIYNFPFSHHIFKPNILPSIGVKMNSPNPITLFNSIIEDKWNHWTLIFTDGSKLDASNSSGAAFLCQNNGDYAQFRLPSSTSVFSSECIAIREALQYVKSYNLNNCLILTDSLSSILKIQSNPFKHPDDALVLEIRSLLFELNSKELQVTLAWIPSHHGIPGNEKVDSLAKKAITSGDTKFSKIPIDDLLISTKEKLQVSWTEQWNISKLYKGIHYAQVQPDIPKSLWFKKINLNKNETSTICRMRLGHCCMKSHLARLKVCDSPMCECLLGEEDLNHIFLFCPINDRFPSFLPELAKHSPLPTSIHILLNSPTPPILRLLLNFLHTHQYKL
jgi:ribonuclease HI